MCSDESCVGMSDSVVRKDIPRLGTISLLD